MKIFVIGPIFPYRGGIAHSNRLLCENLEKNHDVTAISFSRLYPKILFPGKSQKESHKDPSFKVKTKYLIDSINPVSWIKTAEEIKKEKPDWIIFHWWYTAFMPCYWTIASIVKKNKQTRISIVCHSFVPHDQSHGFHGFFTKFFFKKADCFTAFSSSVQQEIQNAFPNKPSGWIIEPSYEKATENNPKITREKSRKKLGVQGNILLFFGFIRPYKGLLYLIQAMPQVLKKIPITLIIAGEFWKGKEKYLENIRKNGLEKNVLIFDEYIPASEVQYYFKAADALVLPYITSTNSAVLKMAFGFNTPIISTRIKNHEDLITQNQTGILVPPKNARKLAQGIIRFFEASQSKKLKKNMKEKKKLFEWSLKKEKTLFNSSPERD